MKTFQKRIGDIVELTNEGRQEILLHKNNYTDNTKPLSSKERTWGALDMGNLWVGMIVSIAVYQVASGLIVSGMSWAQALFTIVLGHSLVMIFAVILGHFGTKYGANYPMFSRMVFGIKGTIVPSLVRGILGCFWFGVQAWIGGQALHAIISTIIPFWEGMGFTSLFISFLLFWAINVFIAGSGSKAVKLLANYAAPSLIVLSFIVIIWGMSTTGWSLPQLFSTPSLQGKADVDFMKLFFPALSSMIAFDGGIALSMSDFTRNNKTQKSQFLGQLVSAPLITLFISFVGICGTAGAANAFGEEIWEPAVLVSRFDNPIVVIIFSLFIIGAVLTTNVAANLVPPTNVISTLFAKKISYKTAALIAAVLALFAQPWNALSSAYELIFNVTALLGALLGPISGLYFVSYLFEYKTEVDLVSLYREDGGVYYYTKGWNIPIIVIFLVTTFFILLGRYVPSIRFIFDNAYVIGSFGAGIIYYIYLAVSGKLKGK